MEDTSKVSDKIAELLVETGDPWIAVGNTSHAIDVSDMSTDNIKVFVCAKNGQVCEYPYSQFEV